MKDIDKAMKDPASVYSSPRAVLKDEDLIKAQKLEILCQWETDARLMQVAEEENMAGGEDETTMLGRIMRAIHKLEGK